MRTYTRLCKQCGSPCLSDWRRRDYCEAHRLPSRYAREKAKGILKRGTCPDCGSQINRQSARCKPCETARRNRARALPIEMVGASDARYRCRQAYALADHCQDCGGVAQHRHHMDENPRNNAPENIAHLCASCHSKRHLATTSWRPGQPKLRPDQVAAIREDRGRATLAALAARHGVSKSTIFDVLHGSTWR